MMKKDSTLYVESKGRVFNATTALLTAATYSQLTDWSLTGTLESGPRQIRSYRANSLLQPDYSLPRLQSLLLNVLNAGSSRAG